MAKKGGSSQGSGVGGANMTVAQAKQINAERKTGNAGKFGANGNNSTTGSKSNGKSNKRGK